MASDVLQAESRRQPQLPAPAPVLRPRVWPAVGLVAVFWSAHFVLGRMELATVVRFGTSILCWALLTLAFTLWWFLSRRRTLAERLAGFGTLVGGGFIAVVLCWHTFQPIGLLLTAVPFAFTTWTAWLLVARSASALTRLLGLVVVILLTSGAFTLVRMDGLRGEQQAEIHWRWRPTAEERFLAERGNRVANPTDARPTGELNVRPGDWPGYRGPNRDGAVHGLTIATDWDQTPPRLCWERKQRVGPAWSSMAVVGDRLFTQEQRELAEAVVCLNANTGREVWSHEDAVRFEEGVSGAGPRATPAVAGGRVYTLGATGILNCLDAASGERKWWHDAAADGGAKAPLWGFSSSPLVTHGVVVVYAGGQKGLLAYDAESGKPAWTAPTGTQSYASPQLATLGGEDQVLMFSDAGLIAVNPTTGAMLWEHAVPAPGAPRSIQSHVVGNSQVLISSEADLGTALLDVTRDGSTWTATRRWTSKDLKPSFNDFVVHDGFIYGFDGTAFCCVDLATGKRRWRDRGYGHGQMLLLADQPVLLVISEDGEAILVAASPDRHEELGRFQAVEGKTWNHPALANGRLYVRNGEEIACYRLKVADAR